MSYLSRLPVRVRDAFDPRTSGGHRHGSRVGFVAASVAATCVRVFDVAAGRGRLHAKRRPLPPADYWRPQLQAYGEWFPSLSREEPGALVRPYVVRPWGCSGGEQGVR